MAALAAGRTGVAVCRLCPRMCGVERTGDDPPRRALCRAGARARVALVSLHAWEEPCISGRNGAGTVFFSNCTMRCCFCQNHGISRGGAGMDVSDGRLAEIFLEQQERGAECLELVTPTHYLENILRAMETARAKGFSLRVVYNTNGYELPETLERLRGVVDVFMPDLKYFDSRLGERYSGTPDYFRHASRAIRAMRSIAGPPEIDEDGLMKKGVLVRHLVLPGCWRDSVKCVEWLWDTFGDGVVISLMSQYMPLYGAARHPEINRPLFTAEYQKVVRRARDLGITRCFIQLGRPDKASFIPVFDGTNVLSGGREASS